MKQMGSREIAYLALLSSLREQGFIAQILETIQKQQKLSSKDYGLAYEIAAGSSRMALALDYLGERLSENHKLSLKVKERALLRTALYQHYFMDKIPVYAIVNETIELAKKYCHSTFVKFLNALLRKMESTPFALPDGDSAKEQSIRYSYPIEFVKLLNSEYGLEASKEIFIAGNIAPKAMARIRPGCPDEEVRQLARIDHNPVGVVCGDLDAVAQSPHLYIQNITPVALLEGLAQKTTRFKEKGCRVLDLCSSPGGKLLAIHDLFPDAKFTANDISEEKVRRLKENLIKYSVHADVHCGLGEEYGVGDSNINQSYDVVVLDVPCSNSGVLNKRPEARWRISSTSLSELREKQLQLLLRASELIRKDGEIWFMTCSILKEENENVIKAFCKRHPMDIVHMETILPNREGWDGGFSCLLRSRGDAAKGV